MDLERSFPSFDASRVLFDDDGLLVVDKPAGIPSQASDPEVPDDLPSRLRSCLRPRAGSEPYLGTHQRLDAETSGIVLFTTVRTANAAIAEQFEKRRVKKTYLACVTGWNKQKKHTTLRHVLDGKQAVTHVRILETCHRPPHDRALLELVLETGRTHQARDQLARVNAPIAGDRVYGGASAPRLMLHASAMEIVSPSGKRLTFKAPTPPEMLEWLERGDRSGHVFDVGTSKEHGQALRAALGLAFERRWGLLRAMPSGRETTVFRLANEEGDALPGLAVDFYAGFAVVSVSGELAGSASQRESVLDAVASFGFDGVYEKARPKHASALSDAEREAMAPAAPSRGLAAPSPLAVKEEGIPFLARLNAGLATGFYADQRRNRQRVRAAASGKRVLNLFSYTCAFSVAAAKGGATRTVSVDASTAALERGRESFEHAFQSRGALGETFELSAHELVVMDARAYLERAARRGERFDLVILDPPSFGTAKGGRFSVATDFPALCKLAFEVLDDRGAMLASINHRQTTQDRFRHMVQDAARAAGKDMKARDLPPALDYPASHMKAVWVQG